MTHREALLSLQLMAEERIGASQRRAILEAKAREDAAFDAAASAVKAVERGRE
jgi:hypothetical protein